MRVSRGGVLPVDLLGATQRGAVRLHPLTLPALDRRDRIRSRLMEQHSSQHLDSQMRLVCQISVQPELEKARALKLPG